MIGRGRRLETDGQHYIPAINMRFILAVLIFWRCFDFLLALILRIFLQCVIFQSVLL